MHFWEQCLSKTPEAKMAFGLERIRTVYAYLRTTPLLQSYAPAIITVGGTNGKGSTTAFIESILRHGGDKTGLFTSPHLFRFHERIRVGEDVNTLRETLDCELNQAFALIAEAVAHTNTPLSYFEWTALAGFLVFAMNSVEVVIMEVGLGGRLDATNVWDSEVSVITSIDLDHTQYLGNTKEAIAREKAAIARCGKTLICGEAAPPDSLFDTTGAIGAVVEVFGRDFGIELAITGGELPPQWSMWEGLPSKDLEDAPANTTWLSGLPLPNLKGDRQLRNAASAIRAVQVLKMTQNAALPLSAIRQGIINTQLSGRMEVWQRYKSPLSPLPLIEQDFTLIFDVAHNPEAARNLARNLSPAPPKTKTYALLGLLSDKDALEVVRPLIPKIDEWLLISLTDSALQERGQSAEALYQKIAPLWQEGLLSQAKAPTSPHLHPDIKSALTAFLQSAGQNDRMVIFGSFHTVAGAMLCARTLLAR